MPKKKKTIQSKRKNPGRGKNISGGQKRARNKKRYFFGKISKIFLAGTATLLTLYSAAGLVAGPNVLKNDLGEKYGKVLGTVNMSVLVRGTPVEPVVTVTDGCSGAYPYLDLDWVDDIGVDTFDVYRNGGLLVSGLTQSSYRDSNVNANTAYNYYVFASGPAGTNQSDAVEGRTIECYTPPPPPPPAAIDRIIIGGIDLTNFHCCPVITQTKPVFSGATNIPKAKVAVGIQSGRRGFVSTFSANENGYWSWKSRSKLSKGLKMFYLTISDPDDPGRTVSTSSRFRIAKKKTSKKVQKKCAGGVILDDIIAGIHPFFANHLFKLAVGNQSKIVYSGEVLGFSQSLGVPYELAVSDDQGNIIYRENKNPDGQKDTGELKIPGNLGPGEYKLIAGYSGEDSQISAEDDFEIVEKPLLVLGSDREITRRQIVSNLGWAALFSLGLLGIFLLLLLFEYHLSKRALFQITESDLKGGGMID